MAEIIDIKDATVEKQISSPINTDQFFDAEEGDLVSHPTVENEDDDFLKKIDEAINDESSEKVIELNEPPSKKICLDENKSDNNEPESLQDIDELLADEDILLKLDEKEQAKGDLDAIIDSKSENELLKGIDDDNEVNGEFEEILNSVQNDNLPEVKNGEQEETVQENVEEPKSAEITKEDTNENLLELCESPKDQLEDDQLSNDVGSTDGTNESESNTESEKCLNKEDEPKNENLDQEVDPEVTEKSELDSNEKEDIQNIEEPAQENNMEENSTEDKSEISETVKETDDTEKLESNEQECIKEDEMEIDECSEKENEQECSESEPKEDSTQQNDAANDGDIEMSESLTKTEENSEFKKELSVDKDMPEKISASEDVKIDVKDIKRDDIKKEEIKFKFNFMRKFATSLGKLTKTELEELLLEKITEAMVFRSECTELRTKCEKQDETIDNLKQRIQSITKQYNDLDMIHKRILKDLKDRPDQPITPVKITRAVGLQVYQPHSSNSSSNNLKPKVSSTTPATIAKTLINKRPNESDLSDKEAEAKRKKSTPLRPPLSEKEKASLEKQEATIEQKIRTKVIKSDIAISPASAKSIANGMNKPQSTQSIDLTDEDDMPTNVQQPPALVAIQKTNPFVNPRGLVRPNPMVRTASPNIPNRMDQNRMITGIPRHPASLPPIPPQHSLPGMKKIPPRPTIKINNVPNGIIVSWTVDTLTSEHAEIHSYQIYAYEETRSQPNPESWKHVGDVKALLLPMAVTLTQFQEGQKYHFAVRAVDVHRRIGQFSLPKTW